MIVTTPIIYQTPLFSNLEGTRLVQEWGDPKFESIKNNQLSLGDDRFIIDSDLIIYMNYGIYYGMFEDSPCS